VVGFIPIANDDTMYNVHVTFIAVMTPTTHDEGFACQNDNVEKHDVNYTLNTGLNWSPKV